MKNRTVKILKFLFLGLVLVGQPAFAQFVHQLDNVSIRGIFSSLVGLLNLAVAPLAGVATIAFIYGVVKFIAAADNPDKRGDARRFMIWALIGLFVLISFWGFVNVLLSSFFGGTPPLTNWPPRPFP